MSNVSTCVLVDNGMECWGDSHGYSRAELNKLFHVSLEDIFQILKGSRDSFCIFSRTSLPYKNKLHCERTPIRTDRIWDPYLMGLQVSVAYELVCSVYTRSIEHEDPNRREMIGCLDRHAAVELPLPEDSN